MAAAPSLEQQRNAFVDSLCGEGILDEQYKQLALLQDESNPNFVADMLQLFIEDSERIFIELNKATEEDVIDFKNVDAYVHQLKGTSSSVGGQQVAHVCLQFRKFCETKDENGCKQALEELKEKYNILKVKLEMLIELEGKINESKE